LNELPSAIVHSTVAATVSGVTVDHHLLTVDGVNYFQYVNHITKLISNKGFKPECDSGASFLACVEFQWNDGSERPAASTLAYYFKKSKKVKY
jgi:hypothetical protein